MTHLLRVRTRHASPRAYDPYITAAERRDLQGAAAVLKGIRILHVNATPKGGGVAEMLSSLVPLECGMGLCSSWHAMEAPARFFRITKEIHNAVQGKQFRLPSADIEYYRSVNVKLASRLARLPFDIAVIHDPQPMAVIASVHDRPMISRLHIDCSHMDARVRRLLYPYARAYDRVVVSRPECRLGLPRSIVSVIQPAIDPLSPKHRDMTRAYAWRLLARLGIHPKRPLLAQVSRFDPWKNPLGVLEAYRLAKRRMPDIQLVLAGIMAASDDPEASSVFREVKKASKGDPDIHLFSDIKQLRGITNDRFVNAIQCGADIVLQLSTREGFGLTVTEAMWKGAAVIGGSGAGIRLQIQHGENGYIEHTSRAVARRIEMLLGRPRLRAAIGRRAKASVREQYLVPRLLRDHLRLYTSFIST